MPTQHTLEAVTRNEELDWGSEPGQNGPFHVYTLKAQGLEQLVRVNRKPDSPVLQPGQQVWLETAGANRDGTLKGKIQKPPDQQQGSFQSRTNGHAQTHDDPTRASIEAQVSLKAAVEYATGFPSPPDANTVIATAKQFYAALKDMQS
jgi:hypothetical protein